MLFETHLGVRQGEQGILTSTTFMESSANCKLDFWYHMKGTHIGSLELAIIDENGSKCFFVRLELNKFREFTQSCCVATRPII